jgi:hypothetical protein
VKLSDFYQLYECAEEYKIFDLLALLKATKTNSCTVAKCKKEKIGPVWIPNFTSICNRPLHLHEYRISKNREDKLKIYFNPETNKFTFQIELSERERPEQRAVGVLYILCKDMSSVLSKVKYLKLSIPSFDSADKRFCFDVAAGKLFGGNYCLFPNNCLTIQFHIKFRLPRRYLIKDPVF